MHARLLPQTMRPHQEECIQAFMGRLKAGENNLMGFLATGTGKTTIFSQLATMLIDPSKQRVMVVSHRKEIAYQNLRRLVQQYHDKLRSHYGMEPGAGIITDGKRQDSARVLSVTWQSLTTEKQVENLLRWGAIDFLVIDEAHHVAAGNSIYTLIERLRKANPNMIVLGFTATPRRTDEKALEVVFKDFAYQLPIVEATRRGLLAPMVCLQVGTDVNAKKVKKNRGDYNEAELVSFLKAENWLELCIKAYMDHLAPTNRTTLAFMPSVEMSRQLADALMERGIEARHIDGETPSGERDKILEDFLAGKLRLVTNYGVWGEGLDAQNIDAILWARPTMSSVVLTQGIGRGLRLYQGKDYCLILDLAVSDDRVLGVGTLTGKMDRCPRCGVQFYRGFAHCPACGHDMRQKQGALFGGGGGDTKQQEDPHRASEMATRRRSFLDDLNASWVRDNDTGLFVASLDFDYTLIIRPPGHGRTDWSLWKVDKSGGTAEEIQRNGDLAYLMGEADAYAIKEGAFTANNKNAGWRKSKAPATEKQLDYARRLGIRVPPGATKAQVSDMISVVEAKRVIRRLP